MLYRLSQSMLACWPAGPRDRCSSGQSDIMHWSSSNRVLTRQSLINLTFCLPDCFLILNSIYHPSDSKSCQRCDCQNLTNRLRCLLNINRAPSVSSSPTSYQLPSTNHQNGPPRVHLLQDLPGQRLRLRCPGQVLLWQGECSALLLQQGFH